MKNSIISLIEIFVLASIIHTNASAQNTFPSSGNVGIGTTSPAAKLQVVKGSAGTMGFPYEAAVFESNGDQKLGVYTSASSFSGVGSSLTLGSNRATNTSGYYPGFEIQDINNATADASYIRFNYIERNTSGTVVSSRQNILNVLGNGNVGVGTLTPQSKLAVNGTITTQEVNVTTSGWADYVFTTGYRLKPLRMLEKQIKSEGHLPDMPSAGEVKKNGLDLGKINRLQQQKIEELTLYLIEEDKKIRMSESKMQELKEKNQRQQAVLVSFEQRLSALEKASSNNQSATKK